MVKRMIIEAGRVATMGARDYLSLFLAGLGITFLPHEYFGGLFLAMAGASIMARHRQDGRRFWSIITGAAFFSSLCAMVWTWWEIEVPVQFGMAVTGLASGWIGNFLARVLNRASARGESITDRIIDRVLPADNDRRDGE